MQSKANKWPPFGSGGWILIPNETPDETPPGFHLRWNMFFIWDQTFLIVSFEKTCQKLGLRASPRLPSTSKQMKVLDLRPRAFICFSVFGTRDEVFALVFDILHETDVSSVSPSPVSWVGKKRHKRRLREMETKSPPTGTKSRRHINKSFDALIEPISSSTKVINISLNAAYSFFPFLNVFCASRSWSHVIFHPLKKFAPFWSIKMLNCQFMHCTPSSGVLYVPQVVNLKHHFPLFPNEASNWNTLSSYRTPTN